MERTLTGVAMKANVQGEIPAGGNIPRPLREYIERIGIRDEGLRQSLARDCLAQARKMAGDGADGQLMVRAVEEVQRHLDRALAKALGLNPIRDAARIAGLRAALMMCSRGEPADFLFDGSDLAGNGDQIARLADCLPMATPPEAHLSMPAQPFKFLFFKSS